LSVGRIATLVALLAALVLPFGVHSEYYRQVIVTAYISAIAVYGLNIILGYTGLLTLGHAAFFGIGAYGVALLETRLGVPFWVGVLNIPPPAPIGPISFESSIAKYYLVLAALIIAVMICARVRASLFGRSLIAIAGNEDLARAVGIDVMRAKSAAFMLSTFLAGLAGGMYAIFIGFLGPDSTGLDVTFDMLLYLIVGGVGTLWGPLVGTLVLVILGQFLQGIESFKFLIFGPMLVLLVMFFPSGIVGGLIKLSGRRNRPVPTAVGTEPPLAQGTAT